MAVKKAKPVVEDSDKRKKKQNYPVQRNVLPPEDFSKFDLLPETTGFAKLAGVSKALLYCSLPVEGKPGYMIYSSSDFSISYRTDKFLFEGRLPQFLFYLVQLFHRKVHPNMSQNDLLQASVIDVDLKDFMHIFDVNDWNARKLLVRLYNSLMDVVVAFSSVIYSKDGEFYNKDELTKAFHVLSGYSSAEKSQGRSLTEIVTSPGKIINSRITFVLDHQFAEFLTHSYVLWFPQSLYMVSPARYPNVFPVAMTILIHFRMRYATVSSNCIGVDVLLDNCMGLPHSEADLGGIKSVYRVAALPLVKALDALVKFNTLLEWKFIDADHKVVDVKNIRYLRFGTFRKWSVVYILKNYPAKSAFANMYELLKALGSPSANDFMPALPMRPIDYIPDFDPLSDAQAAVPIDANANRDDDDFFISDSLPEGNLPDFETQMSLF